MKPHLRAQRTFSPQYEFCTLKSLCASVTNVRKGIMVEGTTYLNMLMRVKRHVLHYCLFHHSIFFHDVAFR